MKDLLLIFGPSGVGKSSVIDELQLLDAALVALPAVTRHSVLSVNGVPISG